MSVFVKVIQIRVTPNNGENASNDGTDSIVEHDESKTKLMSHTLIQLNLKNKINIQQWLATTPVIISKPKKLWSSNSNYPPGKAYKISGKFIGIVAPSVACFCL